MNQANSCKYLLNSPSQFQLPSLGGTTIHSPGGEWRRRRMSPTESCLLLFINR
jgi:hypothetical protein